MRAETIEAILAGASASRGSKVAVRMASGWTYGDFVADEAGAVFTLEGQPGDRKLVEHRYVVLIGDKTVNCEACKREFADPPSLAMHVRRRHNGRPADPVIRDFVPEELAASMAARDRAAAEAGRGPSNRLRVGRTFVRNEEA